MIPCQMQEEIFGNTGEVQRDFSPVILQSQVLKPVVFGASFYNRSLLIQLRLKILTS